jgi:hypothetical protein
MQAFQSKLPVVFRPHRDEALSSWLARIAGVYRFDLAALTSECLGWLPNRLAEIDPAPSKATLDDLSRLTRADPSTVAHCTVHGVSPDWLPDWVTLQAAQLHMNNQATSFPAGVRFHVCMACLGDDLSRGSQFLRLEWLCAAVTICARHQIPLQACEEPLSALQCRQNRADARFSFYSEIEHLRLYSNRHSQSLRVLSSFEQALKAALTGRSYGLLAGREFVAVVTDLTWALLQKVADDGTRLAHHLEVTQFPIPPGWRIPITLHTLSRVDIRFRQAILAIIACLLLPQHFATMASTSSYLSRPDACSRLLRILGPEQADALLAHSRRWPTYFRIRMMRAKGKPIAR